MKKINLIAMLIALVWLSACNEEDPGPRQQNKRSFPEVDFDRIEAGDALVISIKYGENFSIDAEGDRRNLDDLLVYKNGDVLTIRFNRSEKRQYATYVNITLPVLYGVNFSGATNTQISGFSAVNRLDVSLSGASLAQVVMDAAEIHFTLSGASQLRLQGEGQLLEGTISGASIVTAFDYAVANAKLNVSGASNGKVTVANELEAVVSGASVVLYRGNPQLIVDSTGSSVVKPD